MLIVYAVSALVLIGMSYGVLSGSNQEAMAAALIALVRDLAPDLGETLYARASSCGCSCRDRGRLRHVLFFLVQALVVRVVFGHRLADYGLTARGFGRHLPTCPRTLLPVLVAVVLVSGSPRLHAQVPALSRAAQGVNLLVWELGYAVQFSRSFFFRGFMVHGVRDRLGAAGVFAMVMPYVRSIHFSKPFYETLGAVIAGSVLGILSLRTGSIAGGVFIHTAVAWAMDIAALAHHAP